MKAKLILILFTLLFLFSPFTQAEDAPVVKKIISRTSVPGDTVLWFWNKNQSYRQVYSQKSFTAEFCKNNPEFFKKFGCIEKSFRLLQPKKKWVFPALPQAKNGKTLHYVYKHNEVYQKLFPSFTKFQQEICKNNPKINPCTPAVLKKIKTGENLEITSSPKTYLIPGAKTDIVVIDNKKYQKAKKDNYYRLIEPNIIVLGTEKKPTDFTMKAVARQKPENEPITPLKDYMPGLTKR